MATEQATATVAQYTGHFASEHYLHKLPYPEKKFTGQTIIVTGSNVGMGLEAARHFVRLEAAKVILAIRTVSKGEEAKKSIIESEKCPESTVEVWQLDLSSYESTLKFAERANKELKRLDVVVGNAGVYLFEFKLVELDEETITVNVVSTFLLGLLLLPKLRETSVTYSKETVLTFTGSFVHYLTKFPEQDADNIFKGLTDPKTARMDDR
jgi:retinol dehydrogenase-12